MMPRVYGYVASMLRDQSAAEDVTALAFERAYRRRRSFRPSRGSSESAEAELRRATVMTAVRSLSPREHDIVALKFAGGLSNAEIARVLGVSESSAGTRLHRTIEKLRKACHEEV
ncbi:MAG: RNA polymerase sigma factor [Solirubrobacteraceae bacterium]